MVDLLMTGSQCRGFGILLVLPAARGGGGGEEGGVMKSSGRGQSIASIHQPITGAKVELDRY